MNIYDISQTQDPTKTYSKTIDEKNCASTDEWFDKVCSQERKLEVGIFAHKGNFYHAQFKRIDMTERTCDEVTNMCITVNRVTKFVWKYKFLK